MGFLQPFIYKSIEDAAREARAYADGIPSATPTVFVSSELERLAKLRAAGALTDDEFAEQKRRILAD